MLQKTTEKKFNELKNILKNLRRVVIALSGGVDSSLLAYVAAVTLGKENVLAVTADSETYPGDELMFTEKFARNYNIPHKVISTCELAEINGHGNPANRCYHCKKELFSTLKTLAGKEDFTVVEGSNLDDDRDYRPGSKAARELAVHSPLKEAGLTKADIREMAKHLGLPNWDKPAYACLTSRFPYNVEIKEYELEMVEKAEKYLHQEGFIQCRVRHYGKKARVEVSRDRVKKALEMAESITGELTRIGYSEVFIDPGGYKKGSMNVFNK